MRLLLLSVFLVACSEHVDEEHPGWGKPNCRECHGPGSMDYGKLPYQCAECHGTNGAPAGHRIHSSTPCASCHGEKHGGAAAGFPDPQSCDSCHR